MYYRISKGWTYIFGTPGNLLQEEDVHSVHLWEVGLTLLGEEIIDVPLGLDLLHKFMDVDLLESWILLGFVPFGSVPGCLIVTKII